MLFLGFVAGGMLVVSKAFPHQFFRDVYHAGQALLAQSQQDPSPFRTDLWAPARSAARGVTVHDPQRAYDGLTLYTSGHAQAAFLVSMDGRAVHEWRRPYSTVWDDTAAVRKPQPDSRIYFRKAHVYPNGDLLAIYIGVGDTPWGYGLVKLDKDSNVIWKYLAHTHHDFAVGEDGRVYVLTHEIGRRPIPGWSHLDPPRIDDFVVVLSPDGRELEKVPVLDALVRSRFARLLHLAPWYLNGDVLHTNSIDLVDDKSAAALSGAAEGQVLLSLRELGTLAVLDLDRQEVTWAMRGPWIGQHDPDILPNGNILLFDNFGNFGEGGLSRVIEFEPRSMKIEWAYAGSGTEPLESRIRSAQERLPNGNTLITESDGGRLLEVTREGDIVWEYVNPVRGGTGDRLIPIVSWGQRIDPKDLEPGIFVQ